MTNITKVSDITPDALAEYLVLDEVSEEDEGTLNNLFQIAKTYIKNYTGRTEEELDDYQDFVIVVFILVQDMWDNRTLYVDSTNINYVIESILNLHAVNFL